MSEFHAEVPQETASEGLDQGLYVAARAGFEPTTLQTTGDESTNEPPGPATIIIAIITIGLLVPLSTLGYLQLRCVKHELEQL